MNLDLSKLTPNPWNYDNGVTDDHCDPPERGKPAAVEGWMDGLPVLLFLPGGMLSDEEDDANSRFVVLARKAYHILNERCWGIRCDIMNVQPGCNYFPDGQGCSQDLDIHLVRNGFSRDPFLTIVEADKWIKQQEKVTHGS